MSASPLEGRPSALKVWVLASRPATLLACVVPVMVGTALAGAAGALRWDAALVALVCSGLIQIGTNLYNDYADFKKGADTSARLGPARATQRGWLRPGQVLAGAGLCFGLSVLLGGYLVALSGWPILVVGLLSVFFGYAYTGGPLPLAYNGLGEVFVMIFFGVVAVCGTYYVQADALSWPVLLASVPIGALASCILVVNNLRDHRSDAAAKKRTLAVMLGARAARWEYASFVVLAYGAPLVAVLLGLGGPWWLLPWLSLPLAAREVRAIFVTDGAALNPHLGATARLELVYGALLSAGVLL
jgi:1,4-dihydroxy-2-naphthoate octaprenyltransferase